MRNSFSKTLQLTIAVLMCAQLFCAPTSRAHTGCGYSGFICPDEADPPPCTDPFACCRPGGGPGGPFGPPGGPHGPVILPGIGCGSCTGGPVAQTPYGSSIFWVSEPTCNLRIEDTPSWHDPGLGPQVAFHLSYRQRGAATDDASIFGVGTNWSCSFRAYLVDLTGGGTGLLLHHRGGAGYIPYTIGAPQYLDGSVLTPVTGGYQVTYQTGAKDLFTFYFVSGTGNTNYFLTSQTDPQGNTNTYTYSTSPSVAQLVSVTDPDGNSTSLYYENPTFANQITKVVDPFSRTNLLTYDTNGFLITVVDVAGLTNSYTYDPGNPGWITSMTTPYGATTFAYGGYDATNRAFCSAPTPANRYVTVTLPTGGHELYLFRQDCSAFITISSYSPEPSTSPLPNTLDNVDQQNRNSFYWGPLQYANLSTTDPNSLSSADYAKGRLRHWLIDTNISTCNASSTLSLEQAPSPKADGSAPGQLVWYGYDGKDPSNLNQTGTNVWPSFVALVLPDGVNTRYTHTSHNPYSLPTQTIATYTATNGAIGYRTNNFYYAANNLDLTNQIGPNGEQVVSNYFSAGNTFHEPDASYDALNQQTLFTYNTYGQVTSRQLL